MRLALLLLTLANALAAADLTLPPLTDQGPQPGKRAAVTAPEYAGTKVHHLIVLPDDMSKPVNCALMIQSASTFH